MKTKEQSRLFACKMRNMLLLLLLVSWFFRLQPAMNVLATENSAGFAGGNGTKEAPYQVSTPEQLNHVRNALDAYFIQTQDIDMTGETAWGGQFYNEGTGWEPIGTGDMPFAGKYDGGGYRILGLKSYQTGEDAATQAGLFGYNAGVIQNLRMVGGAVDGLYAGGIAGESSGRIENCRNTGAVAASFGGVAGGIVGNSSGTVTDCHNTGIVYGLSSNGSAGGIVGRNTGAAAVCSNTGMIFAAQNYAGGIVGENLGRIEVCCSMGTVSGLISGGITGIGEKDWIEDCYNIGAVTGSYAGGIAEKSRGSIVNCYNTGMLSTSSIGGIVGESNRSTIEHCYYLSADNLLNQEGTGLTLEKMKSREAYDGFDFERVWQFDLSGKYPFPVLRKVAHIEPREDTEHFAGGNGTAHNPYRISTPEHLNHVREYVTAHFIQTQDIDLTAATASNGPFYYNENGWVPIGLSYGMSFRGTYDGGGHCIIGLKSKHFLTEVGLFGCNNGIIRNIRLTDAQVSATGSSYSVVGALVGSNNGSIINCSVSGTVTGASPYSAVGGLAGENRGRIEHCSSTSRVTGAITGGIAGRCAGGRIEYCHNAGMVSASSYKLTSYAGGIAGYGGGGRITGCFNTGMVIGPTAGGIVGENQGSSIASCFNAATVTGATAGGLTGKEIHGQTKSSYHTGAVVFTVKEGEKTEE